MTAEAKRVLEQALALPEEERAALMEALSDSLHEAAGELSPQGAAEIGRRIEAVERGEPRLIPGDEVEARIRETLRRI